MSMNIKSQEAHQLAQELADLTGETLTAAVTQALRERLARLRGQRQKPLSQRLLDIGKKCASHLSGPYATEKHGDLLYNEDGLP